jgi:putative methyltransferase
LEAFRDAINDDRQEGSPTVAQHPRWVRINTLKTTLDKQLTSTFAGYFLAETLQDVMSAPGSSKTYFIDQNIPNLLALPPRIDLSKTVAYGKGQIIFQDKASCFPAYLLDVNPGDGDVIDGCAAPGNKTTHLAAIVTGRQQDEKLAQNVIAFERDRFRAEILERMVKLASADSVVSVKGNHDFLAAQPDSDEFSNVGALLLDPSCSGSGIVGRDDTIKIHLPEPPAGSKPSNAGTSKKRKRDQKESSTSNADATLKLEVDDSIREEEAPVENQLAERLGALSAFQLKIVEHAMQFPQAQKITYSTCSVHFEENEGVVAQALNSSVARKNGWTILKREHQVEGMKKWSRRGIWEEGKLSEWRDDAVNVKEDILDACIRCEKGTEDGTMGFFVAAFVRVDSILQNDAKTIHATTIEEPDVLEDEDEWNGFSDDDDDDDKQRGSEQSTAIPKNDIVVGSAELKRKKKKKQKK